MTSPSITGPAIRARDLGIPFDGVPGPLNAITDIAGLAVGSVNIIETKPRPGRRKLVRTGVTAILPHSDQAGPVPVWAGVHRFNGNGEMTGTHWIADGGWFFGPVLITNTHSVGMAHHAATQWILDRYGDYFDGNRHVWALPVVAETYDGLLNDINAQAVTADHVLQALDSAHPGPVAEGNTGGGTGMICYGCKGGTGTSSRRVSLGGAVHTIGVLVQANHGVLPWLTIRGKPWSAMAPAHVDAECAAERGSIIVVIATDAPLLPHQLTRLARRGSIGIGRGGTIGGNNSGDIFLAFSTANVRPMAEFDHKVLTQQMIPDNWLDDVYEASVQATEEAILNAMVAARDMGGTQWDAALVRAIDHGVLRAAFA